MKILDPNYLFYMNGFKDMINKKNVVSTSFGIFFTDLSYEEFARTKEFKREMLKYLDFTEKKTLFIYHKTECMLHHLHYCECEHCKYIRHEDQRKMNMVTDLDDDLLDYHFEHFWFNKDLKKNVGKYIKKRKHQLVMKRWKAKKEMVEQIKFHPIFIERMLNEYGENAFDLL